MLKHMLKQLSLFISVFALCGISVAVANETGTGMPYESMLTNLSNSLTGPVAKAIALIGIVGSGAALIFGGEISGFLKSVIYLVLVCSLLIMGNVIVEKFGSSGYEITQEAVMNASPAYLNTDSATVIIKN